MPAHKGRLVGVCGGYLHLLHAIFLVLVYHLHQLLLQLGRPRCNTQQQWSMLQHNNDDASSAGQAPLQHTITTTTTMMPADQMVLQQQQQQQWHTIIYN